MFVRKVWISKDRPHETDKEFDHWSLALQARDLVYAKTTGGNDEARERFERDRQTLRDLFIGGAEGKLWTDEVCQEVQGIVRRWGYRG